MNYKQLLQAKYNYEAHLYDVNVKLQKMQQEGKPLSKQRDALQHKVELEAALQQIIRQLEPYQQQKQQQEQTQQKIGPPPTMPADWNPVTDRTEIPGQGRRAAGIVMIALGIFFSVFGFLATEGLVLGIFGFILSIIGVILYASGNSAQGRGTTFFGGGFVSSE